MTEKWAKKIHLQGHLHGWHDDEGARARHEHLRTTVRVDGYATTVRRLVFLANVADRQDNRKLRRIARDDVRWLERLHEEGMI